MLAVDIDHFGNRLYRLALRITGVKEDAEAALDDALRMAATLTFAAESALEAWLYVQVARAAHQTVRERRRQVRPIVLDDVLPPLNGEDHHFEPMPDWSDRIGDQALQERMRGILIAAIDALPADSRTALILHDIERTPKSGIAEILDLDVAAVKLHVHHARLFVRKRLSEYFAPADAA
jgi:RNA polymerase sigma-70 factor (ECF subfamily)